MPPVATHRAAALHAEVRYRRSNSNAVIDTAADWLTTGPRRTDPLNTYPDLCARFKEFLLYEINLLEALSDNSHGALSTAFGHQSRAGEGGRWLRHCSQGTLLSACYNSSVCRVCTVVVKSTCDPSIGKVGILPDVLPSVEILRGRARHASETLSLRLVRCQHAPCGWLNKIRLAVTP